jgi:hypothetical protein
VSVGCGRDDPWSFAFADPRCGQPTQQHPEGDGAQEERSMAQQKGPTGQDDAQHKGKMQDARPNEAGRSGGQQGGGQTGTSRQGGQGSQQDIEREKAEKGKGSPA